MARLYELGEDFERLFGLIEDGFPVEEALNEIGEQIDTKIEHIAMVIRDLKAQEDMVKAEAKRLTARGKVFANGQAELKAYIKETMEGTGMTKTMGTIAYATLQNSPERVEVNESAELPDDLILASLTVRKDLIPEELIDEISAEVPDKKVLKGMLDDGMEIEGVTIEQNQHIVLRG